METLTISRYDINIIKFSELKFFRLSPFVIIHSAALVGLIQANLNRLTFFMLGNIEKSANITKLSHACQIEKLVTFDFNCMNPANSLQSMYEELIFKVEVEKSR